MLDKRTETTRNKILSVKDHLGQEYKCMAVAIVNCIRLVFNSVFSGVSIQQKNAGLAKQLQKPK